MLIFLPPRVLSITSCTRSQQTQFCLLTIQTLRLFVKMSEFSKFPVISTVMALPVAFWSQHAKDNLSGFDWLTLNWAKICFVTHSSCPRGLARFPKLFPHSFSSLSKRNHALPETNYPNSQKVCSWLESSTHKSLRFIWPTSRPCSPAYTPNVLLAQVAKLSSIIPCSPSLQAVGLESAWAAT